MNKLMIDLMRGSLLLFVLLSVCLGGVLAFSMVANPYVGVVMKVAVTAFGALLGLIVAAIVTGMGYLLLNINDNLERLANPPSS